MPCTTLWLVDTLPTSRRGVLDVRPLLEAEYCFRRMNHRKRQQDSPLTAPEKRPRSTLPVKRKSVWGVAATALFYNGHLEDAIVSDEVQVDHGLEEAIAALLEIGSDRCRATVYLLILIFVPKK